MRSTPRMHHVGCIDRIGDTIHYNTMELQWKNPCIIKKKKTQYMKNKVLRNLRSISLKQNVVQNFSVSFCLATLQFHEESPWKKLAYHWGLRFHSQYIIKRPSPKSISIGKHHSNSKIILENMISRERKCIHS